MLKAICFGPNVGGSARLSILIELIDTSARGVEKNLFQFTNFGSTIIPDTYREVSDFSRLSPRTRLREYCAQAAIAYWSTIIDYLTL